MRYEHEINIDAPVEVVWQLVTQVEDWPSFTPTMTRVERLDTGPIRVGSQARVDLPGQRTAVWTVTRLDPPSSFVWRTRVMGVTMTATHDLQAADGGCSSTLVIELSGLGASVLGRIAGSRIRRSIAEENRAFKRRAEAVLTDSD
jgi:uncharacterized membrane protein